MANVMRSGVSWFIIIVTLAALKPFKTEDDAVLADPGGTPFILNSVLLPARIAMEIQYINLIILFYDMFRWNRFDAFKGERWWNSRED
jgi:hypothetical protein